MDGAGRHVIFVDANVLVSRTLRDWLGVLHLHGDNVMQICWSEDVIAETVHALRRIHPEWDGGRITHVHDLIVGQFENGRIDAYPTRADFSGDDPLDGHVDAAARACRADFLLTQNLRHFPANEYYEVIDCDDLFCLIDDSQPRLVRAATAEQIGYWTSKREEALLVEHLRSAGCPLFADRVRGHIFDFGGIRSATPRV